MAEEERPLIVEFSDSARRALGQIWDWNAQRYGPDHADEYIRFLRSQIDRAATKFSVGRPVPNRPGLQYLSIRRPRKGHGHIAVYRVAKQKLQVLHLFHTAQDWQRQV